MTRSSADLTIVVPLSTSSRYSVYRRRFYVLFLFSFLSFNQCLFWLTFSPISESSQLYYHINESTINLLLNWGPILFLPCLPFSYILLNQRNGLRKTVLLLALIDFLAVFIRILPLILFSSSRWISLLFLHLGQILNGCCGPLVMSPVSQLSSLWFKPNERTRATTIAILGGNFGSIVAFLINPWIVNSPEDIPNLLLIHFFLALIPLIFVISYFPSQPPEPPSYAAQLLIDNSFQNNNSTMIHSLYLYFKDIQQSLAIPSFIYLCLIGGILTGVFSAWTALFANIFHQQNFNEKQSGLNIFYIKSFAGFFSILSFKGYLAFLCTFGTIIGGLISSTLADSHYFRRSFKSILLIMIICSFFSLLYFYLSISKIFLSNSFFQSTFLSISLSITLAGFFQGSAIPIIYESLSEIIFPLPQSLSTSVLVQLNNLTALLLLFIPPNSSQLVNLIVLISIFVSFFITLFVHIDYKRRNEDERKQ